MGPRQNILLAFAILCLFSLLLFVIFGESGLADLNLLKEERSGVEAKNETLSQENLARYREIDRLKHDLKYVEKVARDELGMIREGEVIIKPRPLVDRRESVDSGKGQPRTSRQTAADR